MAGKQTGRLMSFVELARVKDSYDYMIKAYQGVRVKEPKKNLHSGYRSRQAVISNN